MWTHEQSIDTHAAPAQIWKLFANVAGWGRWNRGIEHIELHGPFAAGTTFAMKPPGEQAFVSTLIQVAENDGFIDETVVGITRVLVDHRIMALGDGRTRVVYRTEISGPDAAELGAAITADFGDVLAALKAAAETSA
jgi:hypothetical protein